MFTDVKQYREALTLVDDPELESDLKQELAAQIRYFEKDYPDAARKTVAGLSGDESAIASVRQANPPAPRMATSLDAMERAGLHTPLSKEEYGLSYAKQKAAREGRLEMDPEVARQTQAGMEEAEQSGLVDVDPIFSSDPEVSAQAQAAFREEYQSEPSDDEAQKQAIDEAYHEELVSANLANIDESLPTASKRTDLAAPPEHLPGGASFGELLQTQPWLEPPLEVVKEIFKQQGHNVEKMTEDDDRYKRFADAAWKQEYLKAKKEGRSVVRLAYMGNQDWKRQVYRAQAIALNEAAGPLAYGIDKSLTMGLVTEALSGMLGEDARKAAHDVTENAPIASGAGQVIGALAPGGAAGRLFGTASRILGPAGRAASAMGAAAATAGTESVGSDLVRNLGERAFSDNPRYRQPGEIVERAAGSAAIAAPFGVAGDLLSRGAARGVRALRESRRGTALADLEQAGMTTGGIPSVKKSPALKEAEREAALGQRTPEDVMVDRVAGRISGEALRRQEETVARLGSENLSYHAREGLMPRSAERIVEQLNDEIGRLTVRGTPLPGREADVRLLLEHRSQLVRSGLKLNSGQLEEMIEGLGRLAERGGDHNPSPFKRVLGAAMEMRDTFPKAGEAAMRRGGIVQEGNLSAMQMRHDLELQAARARNEGAGLPRTLKARSEAAGAKGAPIPQLAPGEEQAFRGALANPRGSEARFNALIELAAGAGVEDELRLLAGSRAVREIEEAARPRSFFGSQGSLSLYSGNPVEVLGLRADPIMRRLAMREPSANTGPGSATAAAISEDLLRLVRSIVRGKPMQKRVGPAAAPAEGGPLNPLQDILTGKGAVGSGRQLGAAAGLGAERKGKKTTLADLRWEEREVLMELLQALEYANQLPAASGE